MYCKIAIQDLVHCPEAKLPQLREYAAVHGPELTDLSKEDNHELSSRIYLVDL